VEEKETVFPTHRANLVLPAQAAVREGGLALRKNARGSRGDEERARTAVDGVEGDGGRQVKACNGGLLRFEGGAWKRSARAHATGTEHSAKLYSSASHLPQR